MLDYYGTPLTVTPHILYPEKLKDALAQLVYDSVWAAAMSIYYMLYAISSNKVEIGDLQFQRWTSGEQIVANIKRTRFVGASGLVTFNNDERLTWSVACITFTIYIMIIYNFFCYLGTIFIIFDLNIL